MEITNHSIIIWITAVIIGSLSLVIFMGSKRLSSRAFAFSIFWVMVWSTMHGFLEAVKIGTDATMIMRVCYYLGTVIITSFFYFFLVYPHDKKPKVWIPRLFVIFELVMCPLYLWTDMMVREAGRYPDFRIFWKFGDFSWIFEIQFIGLLIAGLFVLYKKYSEVKESIEKINLGYMLWVISVGFIPPGVFTIIMPRFDYFALNWLGSVTGIAWVSIAAYSIIKYRQMDVKIFLAEVLAITMGVLMFANIFTDFSLGIYGRICSFLIFALLGYFLMRNIVQVSTQKEELKTLNASLQKKVDEQTSKIKKAYEVEKRAHVELQKIDQNKNDFIIITQHHLRTPLNQIRWYASSILNGLYGNLPSELADTVSRIDSACGKLTKTLNSFLEIVQLKIETKVFDKKPTNIRDIFDALFQEYSNDIRKHKLFINISKDEKDWPLVQADEYRIKDAITVLVDNAVRYNIDSGSIDIKTRQDGGVFMISVINTAIGLNKDEKSSLLKQSFFRSRRAKEINPLGMGVSLLVAKTIIKAHGGDIKLQNTDVDDIISFLVTLPLSRN